MEAKLLTNPNPRMCEEVITLLREYRRATETYAESVRQLSNKIGIVPKREYTILREVAESTRQRSMRARLKLEKHLCQHGCDSVESVLPLVKHASHG